MRILIIEDDKSLAETLRFQLEQRHFETDVCYDGEEGLHFIEQQSHDLILLDRMLPVLDGISVLKITREKNISTQEISFPGREGAREIFAAEFFLLHIIRDIP